jgi:hypothetical protein
MEAEIVKRVNEIVEKRWSEEFEKRKFEIEAEVSKRVEIIKCSLEKQAKEEIEKRILEEIKRMKDREVRLNRSINAYIGEFFFYFYN